MARYANGRRLSARSRSERIEEHHRQHTAGHHRERMFLVVAMINTASSNVTSTDTGSGVIIS
jgi:hypothetical protein